MKAFRVTFFGLVSLALLGAAWARPVLLAPIRLAMPANTGAYFGPAIDGDTVMVTGRTTHSGGPDTYAVHIFERAPNGTWNYAGVLVEGYGQTQFAGTLAVVKLPGNILVFERGAQGWVQTATINPGVDGNDYPFRIDDGAIFMRQNRNWGSTGCARADWVLRKVNGQWTEVATVGAPNCGTQSPSIADVNDGRALVINEAPDAVTPQPPADVLVQTSAPGWSRVATLPAPQATGPNDIPRFALAGSIANNWAYIATHNIYRNNGGNNWVRHSRLVEPDRELNTGSWGLDSWGGVIRGNSLVMENYEWDYELPNRDDDNLSEWRTLRVYRPRENGFFDYYARLSLDFNVGFWAVSGDGRRVATTSYSDNYQLSGPTHVSVFEIPDSVSFAGTQQDTFESGNLSRWTQVAGQFGVVTNGATRVLRQSSLDGDASAYLSALDWKDQSIEADLRPLEYAGNDRWFGLVVRRVDDRNYYYVTLRASGLTTLRRVRDGVVTQLDYRYMGPFVPGRNYRVRFEAVGDQLAVFIDGMPRMRVKDSSFTHGHPGIAGYRTRFEVDNVIVSPATRMLVRFDTEERDWAAQPADITGQWASVIDAAANRWIERQSDASGDARWFSTSAIGNQVVSMRVRPLSFGATTGTQDPWVGIAAHVVDAQNYYYMTLRRSNQVSLRRVVNGVVQVIATVPQILAIGDWNYLRLEIIGTNIRAFVNGDLKIQTIDPTMSGGGRNAMLMYKTAADVESYVAYQP